MARRKQTEPLKFAFIAFQGFAAVFLIGIVIQYISAKTTFGGKDFLPVEITYTGCESYETTEYDDDHVETVTRYKWEYVYTVDGVQYDGRYKDMRHSVTPGETAQRYYDPDNPQKISGYQSFKDQMKGTRAVIVVFWILEILAIFFLILIKRKELIRRQEKEQEEAFIRQDIQRNRAIYDKLDIVINAERTFDVLDPMRKNVYSTQKKLSNLKKRGTAVVGGNPIFLVVSLIANAVRAYRIGKLENKLGEYKTSFYTEYRRSIAEPVLRNCFESYRYLPEQGFSAKELKDFQLFTTVDRVYTEDYIEGNYKNVGYRQADVIIEHHMQESYSTIFSGRLAVYDFKKNLQGQIAIIEKGYSGAFLTGMQKVQMENMAFNQKFNVYATNAHVAFYLLTPQFMEYIMELNARGELYLRFSANRVFLMRNHVSGVFQPDMRAAMDIQYEIGKSYNEIKEILNFIDILNLDKVADEANLRATYSDDMDNYGVTAQAEEPRFGVVDEEDSIFGGPSFEPPEPNSDAETLFSEPNAEQTGTSGLKLKV